MKQNPRKENREKEKLMLPPTTQIPRVKENGPNVVEHPFEDGQDGSHDGEKKEKVEFVRSSAEVQLKRRLRVGIEDDFDRTDEQRVGICRLW